MKRASLFFLVATLALGALTVTAHAQSEAPRADTLRVEWKKRTDPWLRPAVEGYVHNPSSYRIGTVLLTVQLVDGARRVVSERTAWVYGNIPAGDRGYFVVPILPGDAGNDYRITVESFVLISRESPGSVESP
ncbi:MAG: hypothetical protein HYU51_02790 [Candidatus Rokubacteria bacterium]|nr:hypothetical protein [Candidatus Rokubacteria bacterium]